MVLVDIYCIVFVYLKKRWSLWWSMGLFESSCGSQLAFRKSRSEGTSILCRWLDRWVLPKRKTGANHRGIFHPPMGNKCHLGGVSRHLEKKRWKKSSRICYACCSFNLQESQTWRDGRWFCILIGSCLVSILFFDTGETTPPQFCEKCTPQCAGNWVHGTRQRIQRVAPRDC